MVLISLFRVENDSMTNQLIHPDLITKVINNDRSAQFQLFELTKGMLFSTCFRILNDEEKANDALQDAYVEVFQKIRTLKHPEAILVWMKTITVRKAIHASKNRIQFQEIGEAALSVSEKFDSWFDAELLDQAIQSLPDGARAVFTLIEIEGYTHKECGEMLGISDNTSKSQLNYSKTLLKRRITKLLQA